ncbi:ATP-binding protein [Nitrospirillum amazonense]|uniref:sensor histidine kinase n=1 Tax=Nitrospirillum amazonense TaxID=28077 RepID=UPI002DD42DD9|nr:ATP-binding protein [Nitrospirillum amazonense]MEC4590358.1 ATP-binding protein [Nitrospirillum amazonense]
MIARMKYRPTSLLSAVVILLSVMPLAVVSLIGAMGGWDGRGQMARAVLFSLAVEPGQAPPGRLPLSEFLQRDLPAALDVVFLGSGFYALRVWFQRRRSFGYMLFFSLAVISFTAHLHFYLSPSHLTDWFTWLTICTLFWLIGIIHFFLLRPALRPPFTILTGAATMVAGAVTLLTVPAAGPIPVLSCAPFLIPALYGMALAMAASVSIVDMTQAGPGFSATRMVASCVMLGVADQWMHSSGLGLDGWFLGAYINVVALVLVGILLYRRYSAAIARMQRANADLAERLRVREAELEVSHQRLREVERRQTISEERQRLMQDMHDGVGASLISAIRSVERGAVNDAEVSQILKGCLDDLKLAIDSMEPVDADLLLLLASLRYRLEPRLEGSGITLAWDVQDVPTLTWLDPSSALHILRILQEGIANALHHAGARRVRLGTAPDVQGNVVGVRVTIEDDGRGFDAEKALETSTGRGLRNQQRRAQAVGGTITWHSGPMGTCLTLWLPLHRAPGAAAAQGR